jgi:hypothetical protein
VFPFATGIFGTGHWSVEQAAIWREGHRSSLALTGRISEGWNQLMRYGIGPAPPHEERWHAQWSILPWLTICALAMLIAQRATRTWGVRLLIVIGIQVVFWLALTHIKSRFMLPMVVPGAIALAVAMSGLIVRVKSSATGRSILAVALLLWCCAPVYVFAHQAGGAPAARTALAEAMTGRALTRLEREEFGRTVSPAVYLNHLLPPASRVLFIGEATPFYYEGEFTYTTTWDRGPLSVLLRDSPDDPRAWLPELRDRGFTHILINPGMLARWEVAGWSDPNVRADRLLAAFLEHAELEQAWPDRSMLFSLK